MAFLTPLYLLAGLAIGLPVLFHLIRRTPKGKQVFSSLMFLEPSPPKITKRSRVEDWLLLFLRALAVCLIAFAFARPFFRAQAETDIEKGSQRRIVLLIDNSASMQRERLWPEAIEHVKAALTELQPADEVSLVTFDSRPTVLVSFDEWNESDPGSRSSLVSDRLDEVEPTSGKTSLAQAMIQASEILNEGADQPIKTRQLIVVSDFQSGSDWQALNGFQWPEDVAVQIHQVGLEVDSTNAAFRLSRTTHRRTMYCGCGSATQSHRKASSLAFAGSTSSPASAKLNRIVQSKVIARVSTRLMSPPVRARSFAFRDHQ